MHSAITEGLRARGVDCITAEEDHCEDLDDDELLERSTFLGRAFVTQDEDLLMIASEWNRLGRDFAGIVYSHQLRISIGRGFCGFFLGSV